MVNQHIFRPRSIITHKVKKTPKKNHDIPFNENMTLASVSEEKRLFSQKTFDTDKFEDSKTLKETKKLLSQASTNHIQIFRELFEQDDFKSCFSILMKGGLILKDILKEKTKNAPTEAIGKKIINSIQEEFLQSSRYSMEQQFRLFKREKELGDLFANFLQHSIQKLSVKNSKPPEHSKICPCCKGKQFYQTTYLVSGLMSHIVYFHLNRILLLKNNFILNYYTNLIQENLDDDIYSLIKQHKYLLNYQIIPTLLCIFSIVIAYGYVDITILIPLASLVTIYYFYSLYNSIFNTIQNEINKNIKKDNIIQEAKPYFDQIEIVLNSIIEKRETNIILCKEEVLKIKKKIYEITDDIHLETKKIISDINSTQLLKIAKKPMVEEASHASIENALELQNELAEAPPASYFLSSLFVQNRLSKYKYDKKELIKTKEISQQTNSSQISEFKELFRDFHQFFRMVENKPNCYTYLNLGTVKFRKTWDTIEDHIKIKFRSAQNHFAQGNIGSTGIKPIKKHPTLSSDYKFELKIGGYPHRLFGFSLTINHCTFYIFDEYDAYGLHN